MIERELRHDVQWPAHTSDSSGVARNLSATGLYVEMDSQLKLGQTLSLMVELDVVGRKMQWLCEARVVRMDSKDGKPGFGAKIIEQKLVDLQ